MKKTTLFLAALMAAAGLNAQVSYQKVTAAPADENWAGTYLIVCEKQGVIFNGGADEASIDAKNGPAVLTGIDFSAAELEATEQLDSAAFTISATEDTDWPWAICSASGLYIGHKDTLDNGLSTESKIKNKCMHTLEINEKGNFIATAKHSIEEAYNLQYNDGQLRFRYYQAGDKKSIQLYRRVDHTTSIDATPAKSVARKSYENGTVVIIKNGIRYTILGEKL